MSNWIRFVVVGLCAMAVIGCNAGEASNKDLEKAAAERQQGKDPNAPQTQE